jgi:hypothetical protein
MKAVSGSALFADDVALWTLKCGEQGDRNLNTTLEKMAILASKYKTKFNLTKSKLLSFNSKLVITPGPIQLHGQKLYEVIRFKY